MRKVYSSKNKHWWRHAHYVTSFHLEMHTKVRNCLSTSRLLTIQLAQTHKLGCSRQKFSVPTQNSNETNVVEMKRCEVEFVETIRKLHGKTVGEIWRNLSFEPRDVSANTSTDKTFYSRPIHPLLLNIGDLKRTITGLNLIKSDVVNHTKLYPISGYSDPVFKELRYP